jgi:hypothetical protein
MRKFRSTRFLTFAFASLTLVCGCSKSEPAANTPTASEPISSATPQSSPLTGFERDLQYVKNGQYSYIWVFSRKDGKPLDKDDSAFLRTNAPQVVDWVITDEGKRVIGGTNFNLEEGNMGLLKKRFNAEDYTGR